MGALAPQKEGHAGPQCLAMEIPDFTKFGEDFEPCAKHNTVYKNKLGTDLSVKGRERGIHKQVSGTADC